MLSHLVDGTIATRICTFGRAAGCFRPESNRGKGMNTRKLYPLIAPRAFTRRISLGPSALFTDYSERRDGVRPVLQTPPLASHRVVVSRRPVVANPKGSALEEGQSPSCGLGSREGNYQRSGA